MAGGDATGHAQRVPLAKIGVVLPRTSCVQRKDGLEGLIPPASDGHRPIPVIAGTGPLFQGMLRCDLSFFFAPDSSSHGLAARLLPFTFMT